MGVGTIKVTAEALGWVIPFLPQPIRIVGSNFSREGVVALAVDASWIRDGQQLKVTISNTERSRLIEVEGL